MERRSRNILVVLIVLVIAVAVFSSFGVELYAGGIPEISLPTLSPSEGPDDSGQSGEDAGGAVRVAVTPETVQSVIAALERPESYTREITVTYSASGSVARSHQWVDGGWTRAETQLPGGQLRCTLAGEGTLYYWYSGSRTWYTAPLSEESAEVETVHIPTYEDVLDAPVEAITQAEHGERDGVSCIFVAVADEGLDGETRYWVDDHSGLLIAAERELNGETVLTMTATAAEQPAPAGTEFALPDGTVLHTVQGGETAVSPVPSE